MINIVVTSKPVDGLFYYSYEYCSYLNEAGIDSQVVVVCHRNFSKDDYINAISSKYIHCKNIIFDILTPSNNDITLIMGRSMITLSWIDFTSYHSIQQNTLRKLFSKKIISVYSENHPDKYPLAIEFYLPEKIIDLCDTEVYPNGVGEHFEKTINFNIFKTYTDNVQFEYLFLGTNEKYYATVKKIIDKYHNHGILSYNANYIDKKLNNIFVPVKNLMSLFNTYVYTKNTFDPAPRLIQECKYYNKNMIYLRDNSIIDGGSVYWRRNIKNPDINPILNALERLK
jgi:hypothetical protein